MPAGWTQWRRPFRPDGEGLRSVTGSGRGPGWQAARRRRGLGRHRPRPGPVGGRRTSGARTAGPPRARRSRARRPPDDPAPSGGLAHRPSSCRSPRPRPETAARIGRERSVPAAISAIACGLGCWSDWRAWSGEFDEVGASRRPAVIADRDRYADEARRYKELEAVVASCARRRAWTTREMLAEAAEADREGPAGRGGRCFRRHRATGGRAHELLALDPNDDRNMIVEIRGAEAAKKPTCSPRTSSRCTGPTYAQRGWSTETLDDQPLDMGGFSEVALLVKGDSVWSRLKHEGGPHRGAAGPGHRVPGPHPHVLGHRHRAARRPGSRRRPRPQRPPDRRLPVLGPRRAERPTPPTRPCASPTNRPGSWWPCRTRRASSRTGRRPSRCCVHASSRPSRTGRPRAVGRPGVTRSGAGPLGRSTPNCEENRVTDHRIKLTLHRLETILAGDLDELAGALMQDERARQLQDAATS